MVYKSATYDAPLQPTRSRGARPISRLNYSSKTSVHSFDDDTARDEYHLNLRGALAVAADHGRRQL